MGMKVTRQEEYAAERAEEFARRLRLMRGRQSLTQRELGDRANLSPAAVSQLETGERRPNFTTLVSLAKALSTTPDALLGSTDEEAPEPIGNATVVAQVSGPMAGTLGEYTDLRIGKIIPRGIYALIPMETEVAK